eukprot:82914_1
MGALLDGFKLPRAITVMIPLLLAVYFYHSTFYWHFQDNTNTTIYLNLFDNYQRRWFVASLSASADFNAALFFTGQSWYSFWYHNKTSLLSSKATVKWVMPTYNPNNQNNNTSSTLSYNDKTTEQDKHSAKTNNTMSNNNTSSTLSYNDKTTEQDKHSAKTNNTMSNNNTSSTLSYNDKITEQDEHRHNDVIPSEISTMLHQPNEENREMKIATSHQLNASAKALTDNERKSETNTDMTATNCRKLCDDTFVTQLMNPNDQADCGRNVQNDPNI